MSLSPDESNRWIAEYLTMATELSAALLSLGQQADIVRRIPDLVSTIRSAVSAGAFNARDVVHALELGDFVGQLKLGIAEEGNRRHARTQ
jgi:hypothetical protein